MAVRFDATARRAIDRAMIEAERRGHDVLDTRHLLLGLVDPIDAPASVVLASLGIDLTGLRASIARALDGTPAAADISSVHVDSTLDRTLARAYDRSRAARRDRVTDVDVLGACLEVENTKAGGLLRGAGVDEARFEALAGGIIVADLTPGADEAAMSSMSEFLSRTSAWTSPPPPEETTITSRADRKSYPGLLSVVELPPREVCTRVGTGYDSHRFGPGGPLMLGGVAIPGDVHLVGHSDGDAVCHAVTDAILGACGAGDIGEMFADTDPANRGRDSVEMLKAAVQRVHDKHWVVQQVDVVVITERPKVAPYRNAMRVRLAEALGVTPDAVSVKGKTNEGMGWIGRGEGLACMAVATLVTAPDASS